MEGVFDSLVTLAGVVSIGLAAWSGRGHFNSDKVPQGSIMITIVVLLTTILNVYLVWTIDQPDPAHIAGLLLQVAGISMFWLTIRASRGGGLRMAFDEGNPRDLVRRGPYRLVRHPFYVSYIIYFTGFAIATWSPIAIAPVVIIVIIYILAARMEERLFAGTDMAESYAEYRRTTGFFFPKLGG